MDQDVDPGPAERSSAGTPAPDPLATRVLLFLCSLSLPAALVFGGYFWFQRHEIARLKAELLAESELQAELLGQQSLDQTLMPHSVAEIGYVLNPFVGRSSNWAAEGESYAVNSLGLRGPEIERKTPGTKRFLIVGDSVVFGWKLNDADRLSSVLNRRVRESLGEETKVEFITVALPGWNVRSAAAFLESHLLWLKPDLILWWSIPNDIADTNGVIPPGIAAAWASPHAANDSPFQFLSMLNKRGGSFMPILAERRGQNIDRVAAFYSRYQIPIVLLDLPGFHERTAAERAVGPAFDPPWIHIPESYKDDDRWPLSAEDAHPSPWANRVLAVGTLRKLGLLGALPAVSFNASDQEIADAFEREEQQASSQERPSPDYSPQLAQIPTEYRKADGRRSASVLYGIQAGGAMAKAGTLFLRDPGGSKAIVVRFAPPGGIRRYPGSARFSVRARDRQENQVELIVRSGMVDVRVPLPPSADESGVFELSWLFDYTRCRGPSSCVSGTLIHAGFE